MGKQYLNGVLYGTGEIIKFSPYIYSLEEREVGVFTDGKPLYEKTVDCGSVPNASTKSIAHGISNLDYIADIKGSCSGYSPIKYYPIPLVQHSASLVNYQVKIEVDATNIILNTAADLSPLTKCYVTIQYTKTTDTPGSGHYTTNGGEAHHYSLTEQVIGTWVDNKPLYEKTIHKTNVAPSSSDTVLVLESEISPDLDSVHHIEGMFGRMQVNSSPYGTDGYNVVWGFGSTYYHYNWYNENAPHVWLTYQYTKTTD